MGGHAFRLFTPRISQELYLQTRSHVTEALKTLFAHVCVPHEMPSKTDFGDVDFLVAGPLTQDSASNPNTPTAFDYAHHVSKIRAILNASDGRKGHLTEKVMYFAIPAPGREHEFWIQIDVKVCEDPSQFGWERFCLNYATASGLLGSMMKPLGLTLDQEGLYVRVEGLEKVNWEKSFVFLTNKPKEVLKIAGLDKRLLIGGFKENTDLFEYIAGSWLFNPAHFAERLKDDAYFKHLSDRASSHVPFVRSWIPERFPGYKLSGPGAADLNDWYKTTRAVVRDTVPAMYPSVAQKYYVKRGEYLTEVEEHRRRELIKAAIPLGLDGWNQDLPQPPIIVRSQVQEIEPSKPCSSATSDNTETGMTDSVYTPYSIPEAPVWPEASALPQTRMEETPLILGELPRSPPPGREFLPRPPHKAMSVDAKLLCLARWTRFDASGNPYLACEPREKNFVMDWAGSGAEDAVLVKWAKEIWWHVWARQLRVNYVGMWKRRFEKEDRKAAEGKTADLERKASEVSERTAAMWDRLIKVTTKFDTPLGVTTREAETTLGAS